MPLLCPLMWFTIPSVTCGAAKPSSFTVVTNVWRKSCSRHGSSGLPRRSAMRLSRAALQRAQPTKWPKDVLGRLLWYLADQRQRGLAERDQMVFFVLGPGRWKVNHRDGNPLFAPLHANPQTNLGPFKAADLLPALAGQHLAALAASCCAFLASPTTSLPSLACASTTAASLRMVDSVPGAHGPSILRRCCVPMEYLTNSDALPLANLRTPKPGGSSSTVSCYVLLCAPELLVHQRPQRTDPQDRHR